MEWDRYVSISNSLCSHAFVKAVEEASINDQKFFYPSIYNNSGILLGFTCLYTISTDMGVLSQGFVRWSLEKIRKIAPNFLIHKFAECGQPLLGGKIFFWSDEIDDTTAIKLFMGAIERISESEKAKVVVIRDFNESEKEKYENIFKKENYMLINNIPNAFLPIKWKTFDAYLAAKRKRYRARDKKHIKMIKKNNVTIEISENFAGLAELLARQFGNIYERAKEFKRELLTSQFYRNIDKNLGDKSKVILFRQGKVILGHALVICDLDAVRIIFVGKEKENTDYIYFGFLLETIKLGIKNNAKVIDFSQTAYYAKLCAGAELHPYYLYMKHRKLGKIYPWIIDKMTKRPSVYKKNVFK